MSTLLRGQRGTDPMTLATIPAGSRFVILDGSVLPVVMTADDVAVPFNWKIGPASRDLGDASYLTIAHTYTGAGLIPLRPVRLKGTRDASRNLTFTWLRRTRKDGDNWEPSDVPLGEDSESYKVDILASASANAAVLRTTTTSSPAFVYTSAQQAADFGTPPPTVTVRVAQLSRTVGPGTPTIATL